MTDTVMVVAPPGLRCPKETRGFITDAQPESVPQSRYYKRMLAEGSLLIYTKPKKTVKEK